MAQHILVVEDDEMIQSFLALHLKNDGFEVSLAGSGKEMSRALGQADIDLIVLDLGLPDGDGLTLAQEVRSVSSIPIVVATARQGADDRIMALGLGADDYVTKPYDPRELVLRIRNVLSRSKTGVAAASPGGTGVPPSSGGRPGAVLLGDTPPGQARGRRSDDARGDRRRGDGERRKGMSLAIIVSLLALIVAGGAVYWSASQTASDSKDPASAPVAAALPEATTAAVPPSAPQTPAPEPAPAPQQPATSQTAAVAATSQAIEVPKTDPPAAEVSQESVKVVTLNSPQPTPPPEEDSAPKPMAVVLGYGWVLETKCEPIPQVEWWKFKTHEAIAGYVTRRYKGDWKPYVEKWFERFVKLQDIYLRGSSAVTKTGLVLSGPELKKYVDQTHQRVEALRCMAKEAAAN